MHELFRDLHDAQKRLIETPSSKNAKKDLFRHSKFFISQTWEQCAPSLMVAPYGLTLPDDLTSYLATLNARNGAFPWAWFRSRCTEVIVNHLEQSLPQILAAHPKEAAQYVKALRKAGFYWFRQTPLHHLRLGYHTALSALWKMWGGGFELCQKNNVQWSPAIQEQFLSYVKLTASFHLEMLITVDGTLWDGAGATSIPMCPMHDNEPQLADSLIQDLIKKFPINPTQLSEPRLGCPALTSHTKDGKSVFDGVCLWVQKIFEDIYLPAMKPRG